MGPTETGRRKVKTGGNAIAFTLLVLASLAALNLVGTRLFAHRLDLTEDHIYTLSPASRELVANLPDRLVAKAFLSKDVPPQIGQIAKYLRDLLDEYRSASNGKFEWEAIDPGGDPKKEAEAERLGVRKIQLQQLSREKVSIGSAFLGVAFQFGDKTERLPQVAQMEGLEYEISSILKRLTVKKRKIAFAQGQGEPTGQQGVQAIWSALGDDYEVVPVNLASASEIAPDVDALVVMGPKTPYSEAARRAVDDFLMQGKAAAFLLDGMLLEEPRGQMPPQLGGQMPRIARKNETGLDPLLDSYGFKVESDIVMDEQNVRAPALVNGQLYLVNQPYFPVATELAQHETTDKLRGILFPLASSVELTGGMKELLGKKGGDAELVALARSSRRSWRQTGFFVLDASREIEPSGEKGPFTFGYAYRGPLKSATGSGKETKQVRLVVIGDSDFASDEFMRSREIALQNGHFFLNLVDYLVQDEALSAVRGKGVTGRPLTVRSESTPALVKTANIVGLPLLFVGYGIVRWRRRAARRSDFRY